MSSESYDWKKLQHLNQRLIFQGMIRPEPTFHYNFLSNYCYNFRGADAAFLLNIKLSFLCIFALVYTLLVIRLTCNAFSWWKQSTTQYFR